MYPTGLITIVKAIPFGQVVKSAKSWWVSTRPIRKVLQEVGDDKQLVRIFVRRDMFITLGKPLNDRARLEQLCRYVLRPPLAEDRLRRLADGRVRVALRRAWSDGTTHLLFAPVEFLEKLAALTPRPEINRLAPAHRRAPPVHRAGGRHAGRGDLPRHHGA